MTDIFDFNSAQLQTTALVEEDVYYDDFLSEFREFVNSSLPSSADALTEMPLPDGNIHRFGHKKNCWYILFNNSESFAVGEFGSWSDGYESKWTNYKTGGNKELDSQYQVMLEKLREERDRARIQERISAKIKAKEDYGRAISDFSSHPYLKTKQIKPLGDIRLLNGKLLIPMIKNNEIVSYQTIGPNGEKFFLPGGEKKGAFFTIPKKTGMDGDGRDGFKKVCIVEGYATGVSIAMASELPVIVAFDAGNLVVVSAALRREYPESQIIICGDNDVSQRGQDAAKQASEWASSGAGCKILIPEDEGSDWNDIHVRYGIEALKSFFYYEIGENSILSKHQISEWKTTDRFVGPAPKRKMLISETYPMAAVTVLAAMGDAGKGMIGLDLARKVADNNLLATVFGKEIMEHGPAVVITAEDDQDEVHRRLENIGGPVENLYVMPLPNAGGIMPLIVPGKNKGPEITSHYMMLREQLLKIKPKLIIIDPLASFVMADINADPAAAAFTTGTFSALAQETGAAILLPHHMTKAKNQISTPEDARSLVRGSTAIVDGVRCVHVLWQAQANDAKKICTAMNVEYKRNRVFYCCIVKSNGPADREIKTMIRNDFGLLEVRDTVLIRKVKENREDNINLMEKVIKWAADSGHPFTHQGASGVYKNRERLPHIFRNSSRADLENMIQQLLDEGRIAKYKMNNSSTSAKWLDVDGGILSTGDITALEVGKAPQWEEKNI